MLPSEIGSWHPPTLQKEKTLFEKAFPFRFCMLLMVVVQQKLTKKLPMGRRPLAISHLVKRIRNQASERQITTFGKSRKL